MTETKPIKQKKSGEGLELCQLLFCFASVAAISLVLLKSDTVMPAMLAATKVCLNTVIPSLFPFMVLCDVFVNSGAAEMIASVLGGIFEKIFGIGRGGAVAVLLGLVFGFPVGTKSAVSLYERGRIDKSELCHLICFCNGPSSAFLIGAVGVGLFGSRGFGVVLCAAEMLSALVIGVCARAFFSTQNSKEKKNKKPLQNATDKRGSVISIVDAVTSSAVSMLYICAFIVFFSAITGIVDDCAREFGVNSTVRALLMGFFEMTGGVRAIAGADIERIAACLLCAAAVGWSGISVHFQFISLCKDTGVGYRAYFIAKTLRAVLDLCFVAVFLWFLGDRIKFGDSAASSFMLVGEFHWIYLISLITVAAAGYGKLKTESRKLK